MKRSPTVQRTLRLRVNRLYGSAPPDRLDTVLSRLHLEWHRHPLGVNRLSKRCAVRGSNPTEGVVEIRCLHWSPPSRQISERLEFLVHCRVA